MVAIVEAVRGDITHETCDAVVNASRPSLPGGGSKARSSQPYTLIAFEGAVAAPSFDA